MNNSKTVIIIAAYNAEKTLPGVLKGITGAVPEASIIVVDDGSSDGTSGIALSSGVFLIRHTENFGSGAAFKTGIREALKIDAKIIITIGADNQRNPNDIRKLIFELEKNSKLQVVLGSKFKNNNYIPWMRKVGGISIAIALRFFFPTQLKISDPLSGFRAFRSDCASIFLTAPDRYDFEIACCCELLARKIPILEIPVSVYYHSHSTRMRYPAIEWIRIFLRLIWLRIRYFLLSPGNI